MTLQKILRWLTVCFQTFLNYPTSLEDIFCPLFFHLITEEHSHQDVDHTNQYQDGSRHKSSPRNPLNARANVIHPPNSSWMVSGVSRLRGQRGGVHTRLTCQLCLILYKHPYAFFTLYFLCSLNSSKRGNIQTSSLPPSKIQGFVSAVVALHATPSR